MTTTKRQPSEIAYLYLGTYGRRAHRFYFTDRSGTHVLARDLRTREDAEAAMRAAGFGRYRFEGCVTQIGALKK